MNRIKASRLKREIVYKSFRWQKPLPKSDLALSSSLGLGRKSWRFFKKHWPAFTSLLVVAFALGWLLFLETSQAVNLEAVQADLKEPLKAGFKNELIVGLALIPYLLESFGNQVVNSLGWFLSLNLFLSAALWWLIRHLKSLKKVKIRVVDAFYFGPAQIVPLFLLSLILFVQLLPTLVAAALAAELRTAEILQSNWEQLAAWSVIATVFFLSFYWIVGGLFSLIIVNLPGTRPLEAWQSSLALTHRRRLPVAGRLLAALALWFLLGLILIWPVLIVWPAGATLIFYGLNLLLFVLFHAYCFELYSELLYSSKRKKQA